MNVLLGDERGRKKNYRNKLLTVISFLQFLFAVNVHVHAGVVGGDFENFKHNNF
jgi:hypothetical protein